MTSIIIFFKIYSEALQAIKISIITFIVILFHEYPVWNSKVCRVGLTDKRRGSIASQIPNFTLEQVYSSSEKPCLSKITE